MFLFFYVFAFQHVLVMNVFLGYTRPPLTVLLPTPADEPGLILCQNKVKSRSAGGSILGKESKDVLPWADKCALFRHSARLVLRAEVKLLREGWQSCSFSLTPRHLPSWSQWKTKEPQFRNHWYPSKPCGGTNQGEGALFRKEGQKTIQISPSPKSVQILPEHNPLRSE